MARTTSFLTAPTACRAATAIIMMLRAGKGKRGFSLLELVLVLLLIGVSMLIVLPNIARGLQEREVRTSALGLAAAARNLRSRALFDGEPQQLVINLPQNSYRVARSREVRLPGEVRFISVEGGEAVDRDSKRFYFYPNGSGLGGEIVLADGEKSISYLIRLEALTGRIEVARAN
jgi:general secretion pathway protein H